MILLNWKKTKCKALFGNNGNVLDYTQHGQQEFRRRHQTMFFWKDSFFQKKLFPMRMNFFVQDRMEKFEILDAFRKDEKWRK